MMTAEEFKKQFNSKFNWQKEDGTFYSMDERDVQFAEAYAKYYHSEMIKDTETAPKLTHTFTCEVNPNGSEDGKDN